MTIRLGELLVVQGAITGTQRDEILKMQETSQRPFGVIAEEYCGVSPEIIEQAWATQYATIAKRINPVAAEIEDQIRDLISKRQAWQFGLIPIRQEGDEIEFVTSMECLIRALRFVGWRIQSPCSFGICDLKMLKMGLDEHYPIEHMDSGMIDQMIKGRPAA